jgi:hypothetical protein
MRIGFRNPFYLKPDKPSCRRTLGSEWRELPRATVERPGQGPMIITSPVCIDEIRYVLSWIQHYQVICKWYLPGIYEACEVTALYQ